MKLEIGTILEQDTCDEILMDLKGNTQSVNEHTEHWLIEDITTNTYKLYNLDTKAKWRIEKDKMKYYLQGNKKYNIKPFFRISKEVA